MEVTWWLTAEKMELSFFRLRITCEYDAGTGMVRRCSGIQEMRELGRFRVRRRELGGSRLSWRELGNSKLR